MAESEQTKEAAAGETVEADGFASLLQKQFKPQSDRAKDEVESAVRTLAQHALEKSTLISSDVVESINAMIAAIDQKMSAQINAIVHHPDFQQLESAWRGLKFLIDRVDFRENIKVELLNASKDDLITDFEEVVRLEREYIETWSLKSDLEIIFRTVFVVLSGKGAY